MCACVCLSVRMSMEGVGEYLEGIYRYTVIRYEEYIIVRVRGAQSSQSAGSKQTRKQ